MQAIVADACYDVNNMSDDPAVYADKMLIEAALRGAYTWKADHLEPLRKKIEKATNAKELELLQMKEMHPLDDQVSVNFPKTGYTHTFASIDLQSAARSIHCTYHLESYVLASLCDILKNGEIELVGPFTQTWSDLVGEEYAAEPVRTWGILSGYSFVDHISELGKAFNAVEVFFAK